MAQLDQQAATPKTDASVASFTEITIKVCLSYPHSIFKLSCYPPSCHVIVASDHVIAAGDHVIATGDHVTGVHGESCCVHHFPLQLGVMVFKRSVQSRKKIKSVLRPRVRPPIKDLIQVSFATD